MRTKAFFSIFRIKTAEGFQYRMAAFAGATTSIFWVLIEITVYTVFYTYASNREAGILTGLNLRQVISYAWLTQLMFLMQPMAIDGEIQAKIENGDVGIEMCRPIDLYFHWFAKIVATRLTPVFWRGSTILIVSILMPESYRLSPPVSVPALLWMIGSVVSALVLCSAYGVLMCVVRLNVPWGNGPTYMLMLIGSVLSGAYLPLQLWPEFMQTFLLLQPFSGYLDLPLRLYVGSMPHQDALLALTLQWTWILLFVVLGKSLMNRRLKGIIVQGG